MTRVLYVEDEALLAFAVEDALERGGYTVELAHDGEEGIAQARRFRPEVIVTDYMMPRMDGLSMLRALRREGITAPVVMTTAVPEKDFQPAARGEFDAYVGKPFDEDRLLEIVAGLAGGRGG
jgi:CheY-like chemotaxis protein